MLRLITFEGCDGTGKSTHVKLLERHLTAMGHACLSTREPGGSNLGNIIRRLLEVAPDEEISDRAELFLYLADRSQHVREVVRPAIESGKLVLCDRFTDSTLAYQGYGRGVDLDLLRRMNELASEGIKPDLTFLLDCPVDLFVSRTAKRFIKQGSPGERDRFESEDSQFHERVRNGFLKMAGAEPERFVVIAAAAPMQEVDEKIRAIVQQRLDDC
ncbi:MAG: dTMP kinase [Candidatus Binatia bacterium]|jgi:dTMP kinase|nr:dTMP kinase [Candidatus Binatia bacterium]